MSDRIMDHDDMSTELSRAVFGGNEVTPEERLEASLKVSGSHFALILELKGLKCRLQHRDNTIRDQRTMIDALQEKIDVLEGREL